MAANRATVPTRDRAVDMMLEFADPLVRDTPEAVMFIAVIGQALEDLYAPPYVPHRNSKIDLTRYEAAEDRDNAYWWFKRGLWKPWAECVGINENSVEHWWQTVWARRLAKDAEGSPVPGSGSVVQRGRRRPPLSSPIGIHNSAHPGSGAGDWDAVFAAYYREEPIPETADAD